MFVCEDLNLKELKEMLKIFKKLKSSGDVKPILGDMLLKVQDDYNVTAEVTDLDVTIRFSPVYCLETQEGAILIDVKRLHEILKSFKDGQVSILQVSETEAMVIINGQTKITIPINEHGFERDFPRCADETVNPEIFYFDKENLLTYINRALPFAAKDDFMRNLYGAHFERDFIVAADGFVLTALTAHEINRDVSFVVPRPTLEILKTSKKMLHENVILKYDTARTIFESGRLKVITRDPDVEFPDWKRVIPKHSNTELHVSLDWTTMLKTARDVTETDAVILNVNGSICLEALRYAGGKRDAIMKQELPGCKITGDDVCAAYNPEYLLKMFKAGDIEKIEIVDKNSPLLAHGREGDDYIVMPIRMDDI